MNIKKVFIYGILAIFSLVAGIYSPSVFNSHVEKSFLKTSMFEIMNGALENANKMVDESIISDADLSLEKVVLRKEDGKYETIFKIKNTGSYVKNLQVVFGNDLTEDYLIVKNTDLGLTLNKDEEYVGRDFKFIMDEKYSGADVNFYIKVLNNEVFEANTSNNYFQIRVNQFRSEIDDFFVSAIDENNGISFDYKINDFLITEKSYEVYISNRLSFNPVDEKYRETYLDEKIYPYSEIPLSEAVYKSGNWKTINSIHDFPASIQVFDDAFKNLDETFYLMLKVNFDTETASRYKLSNVLKVGPYETVSKEDFAQMIYDITGNGADVSSIQGDIVLRAEALKFLFEYFEIDVESMQSKKILFKDIKPGNEYYSFAQALREYDFSKGLTDYFAPQEPLTKQFLYLLINESI